MENFLKNKISSGKTVVGIWSIIPSAAISEIAAIAGLDFQILDMEHGQFDFGTLESSIRASESSGCSPLVRIGELNSVSAQRALDSGAHGLIFPQIKTEDDAKKAVGLSHFHPKGVRGFNPFTRANAYGLGTKSEVQRDLADFSVSGIIIENQEARKNLDQILKTEQLDVVYLGAYDMSVALGRPGDMANPELVSFLNESIKKIRDSGKAAGVMARTAAEAETYAKIGANFLVIGVDSFLIGAALRNSLENIKRNG